MPPTHNPSEGEAVPMREMYEAFERLRIAVDRELADYIYPPTNDYEENLELLRRSVGRLEFQEMREGIDHLLALLKEDYSRLSIFTMGAIGDELKSAFRSLSALLKDQKYRITRAIQIHVSSCPLNSFIFIAASFALSFFVHVLCCSNFMTRTLLTQRTTGRVGIRPRTDGSEPPSLQRRKRRESWL